jgi:hypothetical protein
MMPMIKISVYNWSQSLLLLITEKPMMFRHFVELCSSKSSNCSLLTHMCKLCNAIYEYIYIYILYIYIHIHYTQYQHIYRYTISYQCLPCGTHGRNMTSISCQAPVAGSWRPGSVSKGVFSGGWDSTDNEC